MGTFPKVPPLFWRLSLSALIKKKRGYCTRSKIRLHFNDFIASEAWQSLPYVIASAARQSRMEIMHLFSRDCFTLFTMTRASYEIATLRSQ